MNGQGLRNDLTSLRLAPEEKRSGSSRKRIILIGIGLVFGLALIITLAIFASNSSQNESETQLSAAAPAPQTPIQKVIPSRRSADTVAAGGYLEARKSASVQPARDGVVSAIHVKLGEPVRAGDLLLELENSPDQASQAMAEAELALAQARLRLVRGGSRIEEVQAADSEAEAAEAGFEEARQSLARLESLAPQGAVTAAEVDRARQQTRAAEARLKALRARERMLRRGNLPTEIAASEAQKQRAEASLQRAEALVELAKLRAPFDGTVVEIDIEPGEVVSLQSKQDIIIVSDLSELWARADIPEARISLVKLGAQAEVVVDALGQDRLKAVVVEIAPVADRQSNTVSVAVKLVEPPELLRPNMSARIFIKAHRGDHE